MRTRRAVAVATPALLGYCLACGDSPSQPGSALKLDVVGGNGQSAQINTELPSPLIVRVTDAGGQPVEGQIVNFRVTSGGGSMFAGAGSTNAQGIVQDRWTLGPDPGSQTAEARAVDNATGAAIVFQTFTATATTPPAPPTLEVVSGPGQGVMVGTRVPTIVFRAKDEDGAPVPNLTFTLRSITCSESNGVICSSAPGGDQLTNPTLTTGADGTAAFNGWTVPTQRKELSCLAGYPGTAQPKNGDDLGLGQVCVSLLPGPPAELVKLSVDGQQAPAGTVLLSMGVRVRDQYGNTVGCIGSSLICSDPSEVQVTFTPSAGGQVSKSPVLSERGIAYTDWTITNGSNTLTIAVGSLSVSYTATGN